VSIPNLYFGSYKNYANLTDRNKERQATDGLYKRWSGLPPGRRNEGKPNVRWMKGIEELTETRGEEQQ
jgi:hypothetical protein